MAQISFSALALSSGSDSSAGPSRSSISYPSFQSGTNTAEKGLEAAFKNSDLSRSLAFSGPTTNIDQSICV